MGSLGNGCSISAESLEELKIGSLRSSRSSGRKLNSSFGRNIHSIVNANCMVIRSWLGVWVKRILPSRDLLSITVVIAVIVDYIWLTKDTCTVTYA